MRDNNKVFAHPSLVSLDAFGTIYRPRRPVAEQYASVAGALGIDKSAAEIERRFRDIYAELQTTYPNYGKHTGLDSPEQWWLEMVVRLFEVPHYTKDPESARLCRKLVDHFTSSAAYQLYDDVIPVLSVLRDHAIPVVVATNSDPRVSKVLHSLGVSEYIGASEVYTSYDVGCEKPDRRFFQAIARAHAPGRPLLEFLENCWHIGDSYNKDFLGSVRAGWNGVFLDRSRQSPFFAGPIPVSEVDGCFTEAAPAQEAEGAFHVIANNRMVISGLAQILLVFEFGE